MAAPLRTALFDFDGTLVDSDAALLAPFEALAVPPDRRPPLGLPLGEACDRAGITVAAYLEHYDAAAAQPFPGVAEVVTRLERWGLCSNKGRASGEAELARLGWAPEAAFFSDDFDGRPKELVPLLAALGLRPEDALFVGDTEHDRACARAAGVDFALAGWNARVRPTPDDVVLATPADLLAVVR